VFHLVLLFILGVTRNTNICAESEDKHGLKFISFLKHTTRFSDKEPGQGRRLVSDILVGDFVSFFFFGIPSVHTNANLNCVLICLFVCLFEKLILLHW
jgi:hypothetical protein